MRMTFAFALPLLVVAVLALPATAGAQKIKQVVVTNLPEVQDVYVTNPPARFQLVGFTNLLYDGNQGGVFSITRKCQIEFEGARICTADEVRNTTALPNLPVGSHAWVGLTCASFSRVDQLGTVISADTAGIDNRSCTIPHPLACCAPVP